MPNTYDLITTQTLGTAAATIAISIPSSYTDIQIRTSLRSSRTALIDGVFIYFNADSNTANYNRLTFYDEDGALGSEVGRGNGTSQQWGGVMAASIPSGIFSNGVIDLINYTSNAVKSFNTYQSGQRTGGATRNIWSNYMNWTGTATITTVTLIFPSSSNFIAGSSVSVYGIKKA